MNLKITLADLFKADDSADTPFNFGVKTSARLNNDGKNQTAFDHLSARMIDSPNFDTTKELTAADFLRKVLAEQPIKTDDNNAKKEHLTMRAEKPSAEMSREDYQLAFRRAVYQKALGGLKLSDEEIRLADKTLIEAGLYDAGYNPKHKLETMRAVQDKQGAAIRIEAGRENIERANRAGQAVLQYKQYQAQAANIKKANAQSTANQMLIDPLRLGGNVPVRWLERTLNVPQGILREIDKGEIMPGSSTARSIGETIGEQITGQPAPSRKTASESIEELTGAKLPAIPDVELPRPFEYQTDKYKADGKTGEEVGATAIDILLLKRGIVGKPNATPESLKALGGIPEVKATAANPLAKTVKSGTANKIGRLEFEPNASLSNAELKVANKLLAEGKNLKVLKEIENQKGVRTPDFEIDGIRTELKTVENLQKIDANNLSKKISGRILEGGGQASTVILDVTEQAGMTKAVAERSIGRAFGRQTQMLKLGEIQKPFVLEVRVFGKDFDVTILYRTN